MFFFCLRLFFQSGCKDKHFIFLHPTFFDIFFWPFFRDFNPRSPSIILCRITLCAFKHFPVMLLLFWMAGHIFSPNTVVELRFSFKAAAKKYSFFESSKSFSTFFSILFFDPDTPQTLLLNVAPFSSKAAAKKGQLFAFSKYFLKLFYLLFTTPHAHSHLQHKKKTPFFKKTGKPMLFRPNRSGFAQKTMKNSTSHFSWHLKSPYYYIVWTTGPNVNLLSINSFFSIYRTSGFAQHTRNCEKNIDKSSIVQKWPPPWTRSIS